MHRNSIRSVESPKNRTPRNSLRSNPFGLGTVALLLLTGLGLSTLTACEERSPMEEAVEEVKDETNDAKEAIEDEVDDHS